MTVHRRATKSWFRHERDRRTWVLICTTVALAISIVNPMAQVVRPAPNAPQGAVRVQLFDVYSGLALANADVEVTSDNGIRCRQAPCPTNGSTWSDRSDTSGIVTIPGSAIQSSTYVKTKDHRAVALVNDRVKDSARIHQIELYPEWLFDEQHDWTRGYKLVDASSGKTLANTPVHIEFPRNDWPAQHGGITSLELKTNPLGYVFFSFLRKPEPKPGQALPDAPLADWMTPEAWVIVSGFGKARLNYFEGSDDERSRVRLQRQ